MSMQRFQIPMRRMSQRVPAQLVLILCAAGLIVTCLCAANGPTPLPNTPVPVPVVDPEPITAPIPQLSPAPAPTLVPVPKVEPKKLSHIKLPQGTRKKPSQPTKNVDPELVKQFENTIFNVANAKKKVDGVAVKHNQCIDLINKLSE